MNVTIRRLMRRLAWPLLLSAAAAASAGFATQALAQVGPAPTPPPAAATNALARTEAAERFDRGLVLFNEGDTAGALSEFKRAYELVPNALALFNIALTYAALHRPVDAVDALETVLGNPAGLTPAQREAALSTKLDQARRIALLHVTSNVPADISVDGVLLARTPSEAPVRVAQGTHVVSAAAPDRLTRNREITIAGGEQQRVELELPPTSNAAAQLTIASPVPDVEVSIDGVSAGKTPFAASINLEPGRRTVSAHRDGYLDESRELELAKGGTGRVSFALREDPRAPPEQRGELELRMNEPVADVYIDGVSHGAYTAVLTLPVGLHALRIERAGFEAVERQVTIASRQRTALSVALVATADTRAAYAESVSAQHTRAWVTLVAGAVVMGAGGTLAAISQVQHGNAVQAYNQLWLRYVPGSALECDPMQGTENAAERRCAERLSEAKSAVDRHALWRSVGFVAGGVGAAALITGVVLLATSDASDKYERTSPVSVRGMFERGVVGAVVSGTF